MTPAKMHEIKAMNHIDGVIAKSILQYNILMNYLKSKQEEWNDEKKILRRINPFDIESEKYDRMNYLDALVRHAEKILIKHQYKKVYHENSNSVNIIICNINTCST